MCVHTVSTVITQVTSVAALLLQVRRQCALVLPYNALNTCFACKFVSVYTEEYCGITCRSVEHNAVFIHI
jgi:hypothetical protein